MEFDRRSFEVDVRFAPMVEGRSGVGTLSGYAAVFGAMSSPMGAGNLGAPIRGGGKRFRETLAPGAFRTALEAVAAGENVFAFYHHGTAGGMGMHSGMPLGTTRDGSLRLKEDGHGLAFELDLPDTTDGRDVAVLAARGTIRGASFAMPVQVKDTWRAGDDGIMVRTIHDIGRLLDVSPTHLPAYQETSLALRSLEAFEADQAAAATAAAQAGDADARRRRRLKLADLP